MHYLAATVATLEREEGAALTHFASSMLALASTARIAPRCPEIAADLTRALVYLERFDNAERECERALSVEDPTDPILHDASYGRLDEAPHRNSFHGFSRVGASRMRLQSILGNAQRKKNKSCTGQCATGTVIEGIAPVFEEVSNVLAIGERQGAADALLCAREIARKHAMSPLAHHLHFCMHAEFVYHLQLNLAIDRLPFYRHAFDAVHRAVELAPHFIEIAHSHVSLLLFLGFFLEARDEIARIIIMQRKYIILAEDM